MRRSPIIQPAVLLAALGSVACSSEEHRNAWGPDGAASATIAVTGVITDDSASGAPLDSVEVCRVDASGAVDHSVACVTSDTGGAFSLSGLKANAEHIVRFEKTGYDVVLRAIDAKASDLSIPYLPVGKSLTAPSGASDPGWDPAVAVDPSKGSVSGFFVTGFPAGVSVTLSPGAGDGPFYDDGTGAFVPGATSTVAGGWGWFVNLPTGSYELTFASSTLDCQKASGGVFGFPGGAHGVRVPVVQGMVTQAIGVDCR